MHTYYYAILNSETKEVKGMISSECESVADFVEEYKTKYRKELKPNEFVKQCYNLRACLDYCDNYTGKQTVKGAWDW